MKRLMVIFLWTLAGATGAWAQSAKVNPEVQLYLMGGMKGFAPKPFNREESVSPAWIPTLGAGALYQLKNIQVGMEFNYLDGKKDTDQFGSILTGINANILAGYRWSIGSRAKLSLQTGFAYSLHHLAVTDNHYSGSDRLNTTVFHNLSVAVPVSLLIQRVSPSGLFTGLKVGYHVAVGANSWRYMEGHKTEVYTSGVDGLFFQLVFGGLLTLKPQKE